MRAMTRAAMPAILVILGAACSSSPQGSPADASTDASGTDAISRDGDDGGDARGDGDAAQCAPVSPAADVDPWSVRAPGAGFGGIVMQNGAYHDVFLQSPPAGNLPANYSRIGVRLDWGGSIVFFGLPSSNTIDAHDTGREVQVALYDQSRAWEDCAYDASCTGAAPCGTGNNFLGWDPVQGGDFCQHGSPAGSAQSGDSLVVSATPIMWNPNWAATTCVSTCPAAAVPGGMDLTMGLRYLGATIVEVALEVRSTDKLTHTYALQEFPCLYPSMGQLGPDMPNFFDASGASVALSATAKMVTSPAPYVIWQDAANTYGIGIGSDQGIHRFWGIRDDATPFRYARADTAFAIGPGAVVRGIGYLGLGDVATVQAEMSGVLAARPPFGVVDSPPGGTVTRFTAGVPVPLAGWVLDTVRLAHVSVQVAGAEVATLPVSAARPDVCGAYPNYDGCPTTADPNAPGQVGFAGTVSTASLSSCEHLLRVVATDADGNRTVLGERAIQAR
jgi:hypothetical protein